MRNGRALHHALQAERLFNQQHHAQGRHHHDGRKRRDGRIKVILDIAHDLNRKHVHAGAGQEGGQRHVVKRIDDRHDAGRGNAGFDVGQNDVEERVGPRRAEAASGFLHRKIEVRKAGRNHAHDVRNRKQRMTDQQAGNDRQIILVDHIAQHDETEHDARNQHRGQEHRLDRVLALEIVPIQRVSRRQTQQQRNRRAAQRDEQTQLGGLGKSAHRKHLLIPPEREALARKFQIIGIAEGGRHDDHQRPDQKQIDQHCHQKQQFVLFHRGSLLRDTMKGTIEAAPQTLAGIFLSCAPS